jgi:hypothetical protein
MKLLFYVKELGDKINESHIGSTSSTNGDENCIQNVHHQCQMVYKY